MRCAVVLFVAAALAAFTSGAPAALTQIQTIALPSVEGRIDHLAYDAAGRKLLIAALGNNTVEVVDSAGGARLRSLAGFREPQGIAILPDLRVAAVANGQGDGAQIVDLSSFSPVRAVRLGDDADNVRYDAAARRLYVGYGGGALAAIDAAGGTVTARVALPAHPESFQLETGSSRLYVNLPDAHQIAVVDRAAMKIVASWPVREASANFPMALDETGHRLFIGCRRPARLLVYDTRSGTSVAATDIAGDTDDLFFDAARHRVYVIGGEGFIDVLDVAAAVPARVERLTTGPGARTGLFVPGDSRLFLAVPHRGAQRAEIRVFEAR